MTYVVATSGWRFHTDKEFIFKQMNGLAIALLMDGNDLFFRVGDAKGADAIVREWLRQHPIGQYQIYTADWDQLGNTAGPDRNREMLEGRYDPHGVADVLIAFPQPGVYRYRDSGTWGCCKEAFRKGIEVLIPAYKTKENIDD